MEGYNSFNCKQDLKKRLNCIVLECVELAEIMLRKEAHKLSFIFSENDGVK